ncbi:MAG: hypothetical protein ABSE73_06915 [Planctomycetota bacterium]
MSLANPKRTLAPNHDVFLNVPYDKEYESLFIALIAGLCGLGLKPRCVLEIPFSEDEGGGPRLKRIFKLLSACSFSIHDLSRVELSPELPIFPRFNMPFELGLAVALSMHCRGHRWVVFEARGHRLTKSLSDLNGWDPFIHGGTPEGVLRVMEDAFRRPNRRFRFKHSLTLFKSLAGFANEQKLLYRESSLFSGRMFEDLVFFGQERAREMEENRVPDLLRRTDAVLGHPGHHG